MQQFLEGSDNSNEISSSQSNDFLSIPRITNFQENIHQLEPQFDDMSPGDNLPPFQYYQEINEPKQRLKEYSNQLIKKQPKYVGDNKYAVQIIQELLNSGVCKYSPFMGGHFSLQAEQIVKYEKNYLSQYKIEGDGYKSQYFINMTVPQIEFQDGKIVYIQPVQKLQFPENTEDKFQYLIEIVNLTLQSLDTDFILSFNILITQYIQFRQKNYNTKNIISQIIQQLDENSQFSYIKKWSEVKTDFKPVLIIEKQINILEKKDLICDRRSLKVKQKYIKNIEKLQKRLNQEQILSPFEFLLTNLFKIFEEIVNYYEQENPPQKTNVKQSKQEKKELKIKVKNESIENIVQ